VILTRISHVLHHCAPETSGAGTGAVAVVPVIRRRAASLRVVELIAELTGLGMGAHLGSRIRP